MMGLPGTQTSMGRLRIKVHRGSTAVVLGLQGQLDLYTKPFLRDRLNEVLTASAPHPPGVVVDLSELEFCDSSGVSMLIAARYRLKDAGRPLALAGAHGICDQVLHRTGLHRVFHCYPTVAEAEIALAEQAHP
ncbi:STAS domain-containing protein [Nonomuraea africana]|uniref:Anti-sigma factor antagonist n=1 Tax=Nonomuraea africana TaxID=46171 RepID=A0ABR9KB06_9ACTN|nr:STAS domain-containing protein [Nonomuraea africana]MBE1559199.1 anti-sigma B factor antagonist [Nonomuraea africana]